MRPVEKASIEIMRRCPRFSSCSVPICPLDLLQDERDYLKGEPRCTLAKSYRLKIGQNTQLKYKGLEKREWAAKQRWDNLSELQKANKRAELRKVSPFIRGIENKQKIHG